MMQKWTISERQNALSQTDEGRNVIFAMSEKGFRFHSCPAEAAVA